MGTSKIFALRVHDNATTPDWQAIWGFDDTFENDPLWKVDLQDLEGSITGWPNSTNIDEHDFIILTSDDRHFYCAARFYFNDYNEYADHLFAIDTSGAVVWNQRGYTLDPFGTPGPEEYRYTEEALVDDGVLYVGHDSPLGVSAYNVSTGQELWTSGVAGEGLLRSMSVSSDGTRLNAPRAVFSGPRLRQFDVATGSLVLDELRPNKSIERQYDYEGLLFTLSSKNQLDVYDRDTMDVVWTIDNGPSEGFRASRGLPEFENGRFYFAASTDGANQPYDITKVNLADGAREWNNRYTSAVSSYTNDFVEHPDLPESIFLFEGTGIARSLLRADGSQSWSFNYGSLSPYGELMACPEYFFYANGGNSARFFNLSLDGQTNTQITDPDWLFFKFNVYWAFGQGRVAAVDMADEIPALRLIQRDDEIPGQPRVLQITTEQRSIRRGPGTYF